MERYNRDSNFYRYVNFKANIGIILCIVNFILIIAKIFISFL